MSARNLTGFASAVRKPLKRNAWPRHSASRWRALNAKKQDGKRGNKYNASRASHNGYVYASQMERDYAVNLDLRVRVGELKSWRRQVSVPLVVEGKTVCRYIVDFVEEYPDGSEVWVEVKGFPTDIWKLKAALFRVLYPERQYRVVRSVK